MFDLASLTYQKCKPDKSRHALIPLSNQCKFQTVPHAIINSHSLKPIVLCHFKAVSFSRASRSLLLECFGLRCEIETCLGLIASVKDWNMRQVIVGKWMWRGLAFLVAILKSDSDKGHLRNWTKAFHCPRSSGAGERCEQTPGGRRAIGPLLTLGSPDNLNHCRLWIGFVNQWKSKLRLGYWLWIAVNCYFTVFLSKWLGIYATLSKNWTHIFSQETVPIAADDLSLGCNEKFCNIFSDF